MVGEYNGAGGGEDGVAWSVVYDGREDGVGIVAIEVGIESCEVERSGTSRVKDGACEGTMGGCC